MIHRPVRHAASALAVLLSVPLPALAQPGPVTDLAAVPAGETAVLLTWTGAGNVGMAGTPAAYEICCSTWGPITEASFETRPDGNYVDSSLGIVAYNFAPPAAGTPMSLVATRMMPYNGWEFEPLVTGVPYWFAVIYYDTGWNWSYSNSPTATPADIVPPSGIADLAVSEPAYSSLRLTWTVPGDDGMEGRAAEYDLRYSATGEIADVAAFGEALTALGLPVPGMAGSIEEVTIGGLLPGRMYYFAVRTSDGAGNWSVLSNSPGLATIADNQPPTAISDLEVAGTGWSSVTVEWTAPTDNDRVVEYDLRYSTAGPIADEEGFECAIPVSGEPVPSAGLQAMTVFGLRQGTTYWFSIRSADGMPNWSALSGSPKARTSDGGSFNDGSACGASRTGGGGGEAAGILLLAYIIRQRRCFRRWHP